jgi:acetyltransferase-like isoleucine patch superfamily enzyme
VIGFGNHPINELSTSPSVYYNELIYSKKEINDKQKADFEKVIIKNDVWIGANVFLKNGIKIGNGAVIGAGSVVLKDVNDFEVVVGVPAKCIKKRFSEEICALILELKWWNLEENKLADLSEIIKKPTLENLSAYLNKFNNI